MRSELSWRQILLRFSDLFYQKSSSVMGSGCLPSFKEFSGSCLRTFFINFYQWIMAANLKLKLFKLTFKDMGLVFAGGALAVGGVRRGKGQQSPALNLADGYVGVSEESVELFHEVFADQVRKVYLIEGVAQHGQKNLLKV